ncbi:hypothetical protein AB0L88_29535 [Saccharopolyspora shandongensis]
MPLKWSPRKWTQPSAIRRMHRSLPGSPQGFPFGNPAFAPEFA